MALGASQLGFLVVGGLLSGLWLDGFWGTTPLFGLLGLLFGFASGVLFLVRLVKMARKDGTSTHSQN
jgi:F0F1-type ATP synthase assembly protein I